MPDRISPQRETVAWGPKVGGPDALRQAQGGVGAEVLSERSVSKGRSADTPVKQKRKNQNA
jgi:hypothetical protein